MALRLSRERSKGIYGVRIREGVSFRRVLFGVQNIWQPHIKTLDKQEVDAFGQLWQLPHTHTRTQAHTSTHSQSWEYVKRLY